jgi:superfamily II DNA or RNA helicase
MAIRISFHEISRENGKKIVSDTTVIDKPSYIPGIRFQPAPKEVQMFLDIGTEILLPFWYAKKNGYDHSKNQKEKWLRVIHNKVPLFTGTLRPYQEEIVAEAITLLKQQQCCIIGTFPGSGKTIMATYLAWKIGLLPVYITNRREILKGWLRTYQKVLPDASIWVPGQDLPQKDGKYVYPDAIIVMQQQVQHIPEEIRLRVGVMVVDEVHMLCTSSTVKMWLAFEPKYVILESATLDIDENAMYKMSHLIGSDSGIFRISSIPYTVYIIETKIFGTETRGKSGLIATHLQKSLSENEDRQQLIIRIVQQNLHRKFIVMQRVTSGIDLLIQKFQDSGIVADSLYGSKKEYKNSQVLVGTVSKMGTGFDEANACADWKDDNFPSDTLILSNSIKKTSLFEQVRGRIMRSTNPSVIWLMDDNSSVERHLNGLKKWITKTNGKLEYVSDLSSFVIEK